MNILPAIDLKDNQCVRLIQGDFDQQTLYSKDPVSVALEFERQGAEMIHVIDLNGAEKNEMVNLRTIKALLKSLQVPIQVGGGIRSSAQAKMLLDLGVKRVILGTLAINDLNATKALIDEYQERIVVSIDAKDYMVKINGWQNETAVHTFDFVKTLESVGLSTIVYTDIARDGMLEGPSLNHFEALKARTNIEIIASGGVSNIDDLLALKKQGVKSVIVGKALYENKFTLKEALACLQKESYRA